MGEVFAEGARAAGGDALLEILNPAFDLAELLVFFWRGFAVALEASALSEMIERSSDCARLQRAIQSIASENVG